MRINNVFKNFLNEFNSNTIRDSNITLYDLKVKYLSTLETLTWGLGRETVEPRSLHVCGEGEVSLTHTPGLGDDGQAYEVQVCGTTGISWRKKFQLVSDIIQWMLIFICTFVCRCIIFPFKTTSISTFPRPALLSCNILYYFLEQNALPLKDKSKSRKTKTDSKQKNAEKTEASNGWILFSDFYEITHIVTKETGVTIYRQDNKTMVN